MTIDQLKRVIWRLQEKGLQERITRKQVRIAIMYECGTDPRTIDRNIQLLIELGWLKRTSRYILCIQDEFKNA